MPDADFTSTRLFVAGPLAEGAEVPLDPRQAHYLAAVLRLREGDGFLAFDGRSGEWRARFRGTRKAAVAVVVSQARPQPPPGDLWYLFAPLKHARLDYLVQKATEMGATRLQPVITRRTQAQRVNLERMGANAIEAAEQCGVLQVPEVSPEVPLDRVLDGWDGRRALVFCDERAVVADPVTALAPLRGRPLALLVGPEGGFDPAEREKLRALPATVAVALGPRILRADTAAVAALAVLQAAAGDWR